MTDPSPTLRNHSTTIQDNSLDTASKERTRKLDEVTTALFYISIFDDSKHKRSDVVRAACTQAVACVCCAADRFENSTKKPVGLLTALEFMFERIIDF